MYSGCNIFKLKCNENFELDNWLAGSCKLDIVCAKFEGHGQRFFPGRGCSGLIEN